jgi:hypothetical protein
VPSKNVGVRGRCVASPPPNSSQAAEQEISLHRLSQWEASGGAGAFYAHMCLGRVAVLRL